MVDLERFVDKRLHNPVYDFLACFPLSVLMTIFIAYYNLHWGVAAWVILMYYFWGDLIQRPFLTRRVALAALQRLATSQGTEADVKIYHRLVNSTAPDAEQIQWILTQSRYQLDD